MEEHSRNALDDCTNTEISKALTHGHKGKRVSSWLPTPPASGPRGNKVAKRRAGGDNTSTSKKRVKLSNGGVDDDLLLDDATSESSLDWDSDGSDEKSVDALKTQRITGGVETHLLCARVNAWMNPLGTFNRLSVSTRSILESFVSSHKSDVFRCQSTNEITYLTPPYGCAFTHGAKRGGLPLLAVSTEQGTVHIMNTIKRKDWDAEPPRAILQLHDNGIFDVKWNVSDTLLATSSADHSTRITCPETQSTISILHGHTSTVKCVTWDPNHQDILATGGRDGSICFWDLRTGNRRKMDGDEDSHMACEPVMIVNGAHEAAHIRGGKIKAKRGNKDPLPKTVTSLVYPDTAPYGIVSSGAFDGILRYWDLRQPTSKRARTAKANTVTCLYSTFQDPTMLNGSRARGIISLVGGHGPTAGVIFGLGADSRVHTYTLPRLEAQESVSFAHEHLQSSSFYASLSVSPCGQWLASGGGTGLKGSAFLFDVANAARPWKKQTKSLRGVELKGQLGEVGAVDWARNTVATCADDGTVRIWTPDVEVHNKCTAEPEDSHWEWAWAT